MVIRAPQSRPQMRRSSSPCASRIAELTPSAATTRSAENVSPLSSVIAPSASAAFHRRIQTDFSACVARPLRQQRDDVLPVDPVGAADGLACHHDAPAGVDGIAPVDLHAAGQHPIQDAERREDARHVVVNCDAVAFAAQRIPPLVNAHRPAAAARAQWPQRGRQSRRQRSRHDRAALPGFSDHPRDAKLQAGDDGCNRPDPLKPARAVASAARSAGGRRVPCR